VRYAFIRAHHASLCVRTLCRLLEVHPSGYYAWRDAPRSKRSIANERLSGLIKQFWLESGGVYGYRKVHSDLRELGERCGKHRVRRLMRALQACGLRSGIGAQSIVLGDQASSHRIDYSSSLTLHDRTRPG